MRKRLLLGPIMIALMLAALWADQWLDQRPFPWAQGQRIAGLDHWPPGVIVFIIVLTLSILGARELAAILADKGITSSRRISTFAAVLGLLVSCLIPSWFSAVDAAAATSMSAMLVLAAAIIFFARNKTVEGVVAATGGALLSYVYLGLMFGFILAIRREHTAWELLWVMLVTKSCDIGAYFTGKAIGKHKLIPWLSPGKTWEGLFGGVALACLVAYFGWWILNPDNGAPMWWIGVVPGIIFAVIGQAGDLFESVFKRDAGIKDSGRAIPGFGGVLDVIDSPVLVGPFAYWWLRWMDGMM